jgi:hypothetical protein
MLTTKARTKKRKRRSVLRKKLYRKRFWTTMMYEIRT